MIIEQESTLSMTKSRLRGGIGMHGDNRKGYRRVSEPLALDSGIGCSSKEA
jgi:hypothetical protein